ncbi:MAG: acyltransferase family protein [Planctomycetota bacterium]
MEKNRLLFIDNLRILLIALVAMIHLSITYGGAGSWYYKEVVEPDAVSFVALCWHNATVQSFSMGLFFMIAGYFTPGSYDRKGPRLFLKDRLLRLGIPMLCYDFLIGPLVAYPLIKVGAWGSAGSYVGYLGRYYSGFHIGTGPLWFVEALLIFAVCYALWRALGGRLKGAAFGHGPSDPKIAPADEKSEVCSLSSVLCPLFFALALGVVSFIVRIWLPLGWSFGPLNFQFPFFPQYICMFIVGIVAYRCNWLTRIPDAMGRFWLFMAVTSVFVFFPILFVAGGAPTGDITKFAGGFHWQCLGYALWEQFTGVALIVALPALFHKWLNRQGKLTAAMSASAYTAYIIHGPVIILVALAIRNISLYPLVKFALAVAISVPLCFAVANVIRKLPPARRIL